ncbi:serine/threonine-protein kinase 19-like protein isoform X1 [Gossypium australe]|uniref:Serine/threonine-protein kinase 19-like protein isoform X1 n=1 Tax=Gossypium australe TaxID=47621 RepID=A0A5B6W166_9ROSI|nr:serine/threonine-protein kinase 19-like protein isoform X1 [Gossypium australe]
MERGKKRRREEEEIEAENIDANHSLSLEQNLSFSDTNVALRMMRAQFPQIDKSQLYSSVKDRTQVDRELESLRRDKVVRIFKLNTGQDDHGIMFLEDYLKQLEHVVKRMEEKKQGGVDVFKWFKGHVIESKLEPSIEHEELLHTEKLATCVDFKWLRPFAQNVVALICPGCHFHVHQCMHYALLSLGGQVKDGHISLLINAGLLTRQLIDPNMYWFAIPNIGSVLKGLSQCCTYSVLILLGLQGRKELLSLLNRRRYKEMMLAPLEKMRLRLSPLDMRFHLRDLIGSGHLKTAHTPSGIVVQEDATSCDRLTKEPQATIVIRSRALQIMQDEVSVFPSKSCTIHLFGNLL